MLLLPRLISHYMLLEPLYKLAKKHLHGWRPWDDQLSYQLCLCFALHFLNVHSACMPRLLCACCSIGAVLHRLQRLPAHEGP
jgi:hypothetical protein